MFDFRCRDDWRSLTNFLRYGLWWSVCCQSLMSCEFMSCKMCGVQSKCQHVVMCAKNHWAAWLSHVHTLMSRQPLSWTLEKTRFYCWKVVIWILPQTAVKGIKWAKHNCAMQSQQNSANMSLGWPLNYFVTSTQNNNICFSRAFVQS